MTSQSIDLEGFNPFSSGVDTYALTHGGNILIAKQYFEEFKNRLNESGLTIHLQIFI